MYPSALGNRQKQVPKKDNENIITRYPVPSIWKEAHAALPVFKKGEHYDPSNYRPVPLTGISCVILDQYNIVS